MLVHLSSAFYASLRTWFSTALAALAIACLFLCGGQSTAFAADKTEEKQVEPQFRHLYRHHFNASDALSDPQRQLIRAQWELFRKWWSVWPGATA